MKNTSAFFPKKHLGQNFLIDPRIKEKIIAACEFQPTDTVLEIGPGQGALTERIIPLVKELIAVETDPRLYKELAEKFSDPKATVIHADFLKFPLRNLSPHLKVIGNLPYYISTPIIEKMIIHREQITALFITIQRELGERLTANIDSKEYGAFTCFVQYYMDVQILFKIKNTAFRPIPKVQSCFLKLTPHRQPALPADNEEFLFKIIRQAFQQRRKTLLNSLSPLLERTDIARIFDSLGLDPKLRAENLTLQDYVEITNALLKQGIGK
ncbi:MAG: ribosomal RNA small subunit methyltransferase A [Omnitrophica WOR_2 bacterium RIFCSPHIGHO2_02_FULL_48_11]|nr:MAG: ribosomal RNA small subunit methyltransferase A [Omnitrophica WOR_2 bacterium RIFCSPHIGHO2_02_FULL_48_11]